jgi:hypothetical protein
MALSHARVDKWRTVHFQLLPTPMIDSGTCGMLEFVGLIVFVSSV